MDLQESKTVLNKYGWRKDSLDKRDLLFKVSAPITGLPTNIDLRSLMPPVYDQSDLGSCTANAITAAISFLDNKDKKPLIEFSRLFLYYNERVIEHTVNSDSGAEIRDGIKTLLSQGVCPETEWPYVISKFTQKPPQKCYTDARPHRIAGSLYYEKLSTINQIRLQLSRGYPVVIGISVYSSFESDEVATTGIVPMPDEQTEELLGGHCVLICGYNDTTQRFIVRNSWGTNWGMQGYFTIPYTYISDTSLASDFWTVTKTKSE